MQVGTQIDILRRNQTNIDQNDEILSAFLRSEKKLHGNGASSLGRLVYGVESRCHYVLCA
jgi:hypothetical protein